MGKGLVFSNLIKNKKQKQKKKKKKNAVIRGKIQTENIVKRGTFSGEHSERGTCFFFFLCVFFFFLLFIYLF